MRLLNVNRMHGKPVSPTMSAGISLNHKRKWETSRQNYVWDIKHVHGLSVAKHQI